MKVKIKPQILAIAEGIDLIYKMAKFNGVSTATVQRWLTNNARDLLMYHNLLFILDTLNSDQTALTTNLKGLTIPDIIEGLETVTDKLDFEPMKKSLHLSINNKI